MLRWATGSSDTRKVPPPMFTIILKVYNKYNEVETRQSFNSDTLRGASIKAGKWIVAVGINSTE